MPNTILQWSANIIYSTQVHGAELQEVKDPELKSMLNEDCTIAVTKVLHQR
jgi:hypothetical protein